ncbi:hypothetical protein P6709_12520 [Jeotgalibacillus sp. ET6]|uniref:hypothetical protein n=1 Tax=Jeotgalibacillus sp. ET6 TaxID=3037260 RepID=UPI0024189EEA|nr:hypothetical protein [Jeotgalibacillus sp. ET6]MDG5472572.1 hypothetical protein [Jeotgalibacillus sp. ET6]
MRRWLTSIVIVTAVPFISACGTNFLVEEGVNQAPEVEKTKGANKAASEPAKEKSEDDFESSFALDDPYEQTKQENPSDSFVEEEAADEIVDDTDPDVLVEERESANEEENMDLTGNYEDLYPEEQLGVIQSLVTEVTLQYDYGIGNPEFLVEDEMTELEVASVQENLEPIQLADEDLKAAEQEINLMLDSLEDSELVEEEIQAFKDSRQIYYSITDEMIELIENVTPDNAAQTREDLDILSEEYLDNCLEHSLLMQDIVIALGLDYDLFLETVEELIGHYFE